MNKNIIRRLDDFGRITLTHDMRRAMHPEENDPVDIVYEDQLVKAKFLWDIIVQKVEGL